MLVSSDVLASAAWYTTILGAENVHPGDEFAMLMHDSSLVLLLHHQEFDEHPGLEVPKGETAGAGVLLYFWVDDVPAAYERAREIGANTLDEPHMNPNAGAIEFSLRDPDGYAVTVAARRTEQKDREAQ
jgi:catechol 2,3-dioxygenase-like lactoylglutathione lyase family enzyme